MAIKKSEVVQEIKDAALRLFKENMKVHTDPCFVDVSISLNVSEEAVRSVVKTVLDKHLGEEIVPEEE